MLGCLNPNFRKQGMRAKLSIFVCHQEEYVDQDYEEYYNEGIPSDYINEANTLQARGFSKKSRHLQLCPNQHQNATSLSEDGRLNCLEQSNHLLKENHQKNSTGPLISPGKPLSLDEPLFDILPKDAFPIEEQLPLLKQSFEGHSPSENSALTQEIPHHNNLSLVSSANLDGKILGVGIHRPTDGAGNSTSLSERLSLGNNDIHTLSHNEAIDARPLRKTPQDNEREKIMELKRNPTAGLPNLLNSQNPLNDIMDRPLHINNIKNDNDRFPISLSSTNTKRESFTLQGDFEEINQDKHLEGKESLPSFNAAPGKTSVTNSHGALNVFVEQNVTPSRSILRIPQINMSGKGDILHLEGTSPSQLAGLGRSISSNPEETQSKLNQGSLEMSTHGTKSVTCPRHSHGCNRPLGKRSAKSQEATLDEIAARAGIQAKRVQPLLNFLGTSSKAESSITRPPLTGRTKGDDQTTNDGRTPASHYSLRNIIQYNLRPSPAVKKVINTTVIPHHFRTETRVHNRETRQGLISNDLAEGNIPEVNFISPKDTEQAHTSSPPKDAPILRQTGPENLLQLQLRKSGGDQEQALRNESLRATIKRQEMNISPSANDTLSQDLLASNQKIQGQLLKEINSSKEMNGFNDEQREIPSSRDRTAVFKGKEEVGISLSKDSGTEFHVKVSRTSLDVNQPAGGNFSRPMKEKSDYDEYSNTEETKEGFDIYEDEQDPRMFTGKIRQYYIAAVEVTWDYGSSIPSPYLRDK